MVYLTTDAGASWQAISLPVPNNSYAVYTTAVRLVPGAGVLVVVSANYGPQAVVVSADHGRSWRQVDLRPFPALLADASFVDATHWWASRLGVLYKTDDAGRTWKSISMIGVPEYWNDEPVHVIDARNAWLRMTSAARSSDSALATTSDGGVHWTPVNVPRPG